MQLLRNWFDRYAFVGFIDGTWKRYPTGMIQAGIGGFILNSNKLVSFIFLGPSTALNPEETELEALEFLCHAIEGRDEVENHIIITTDSTKLVQHVQKLKANNAHSHQLTSQPKNLQHTSITHLNRALNKEVDTLAKEVRDRNKVLTGWT